MTNWDYRILAHREGDDVVLQMHEVCYEEGIKPPTGYRENPAVVIGDDITDISWVLVEMRAALLKPILYAGSMFPMEYTPGCHVY